MSEAVPEEKPANRDLPFTAAITLFALLPRLYVAIAWAKEAVWDGKYYDLGARRIAAGLGYSEDVLIEGHPVWRPTCHYPVGYSGYLALFYRLFGHDIHVATVANAIAGALTVAVAHRLARRATTPNRARVAAGLVALHPGLIVYSALLMTEPLAGLCMLVAAWVFAREEGKAKGAILAGIALGLGTLVRPPTLLCAPALVFLIANQEIRSWAKKGLAALTIAGAATLGVVLPWTARNCARMDGCALVSTNAGWNLAIGAFPRATGRFETLKATDGCPVVTGQVQQDRCWLKEGVHWIKADPSHFLGLIPKKLGYTFDHESFPMGYLGEADPSWTEEKKARGRELLSNAHRVVLAAAALSVVASPTKGTLLAKISQAAAALAIVALFVHGVMDDYHPFWPIAVLLPILAAIRLPGAPKNGGVIGYLAWSVATVCVTHAVFFGEDRYHVVITPALAILAACALRSGSERSGSLSAK
jgi:hypothetical protein